MSAALSFSIPIISSRRPGTTVSFTINPYIPLASCEGARTGVTATAPRYSRNFRLSIRTLKDTSSEREWDAPMATLKRVGLKSVFCGGACLAGLKARAGELDADVMPAGLLGGGCVDYAAVGGEIFHVAEA
jgi:hypothetical protein